MSHAQPRQYFAATQRAVANADAIEWEELPSLASSLAQRLVTRGRWQRDGSQLRGANDSLFQVSVIHESPWDSTIPAALDPAAVSQPFRESMSGLQMREISEPDLFNHFFGPNASRF